MAEHVGLPQRATDRERRWRDFTFEDQRATGEAVVEATAERRGAKSAVSRVITKLKAHSLDMAEKLPVAAASGLREDGIKVPLGLQAKGARRGQLCWRISRHANSRSRKWC
jgi:hypothetical protein